MKKITFIKVRIPPVMFPTARGGTASYTYYKTSDERFQIRQIANSVGSAWQARAMDNTEPFVGWKRRPTNVRSCDSIEECKHEIEMAYARGA